MQVGDESYESYMAEKGGILSSLASRAKVSYMAIIFKGILLPDAIMLNHK